MSRTAGVAARGLSFPSAPPPLFSGLIFPTRAVCFAEENLLLSR